MRIPGVPPESSFTTLFILSKMVYFWIEGLVYFYVERNKGIEFLFKNQFNSLCFLCVALYSYFHKAHEEDTKLFLEKEPLSANCKFPDYIF